MRCSSGQDGGTTLGRTHSSAWRVGMAEAKVIPALALILDFGIASLLRTLLHVVLTFET